MEGNDIEITVDLDVSRVNLRSIILNFILNNGPTIWSPRRLYKQYNGNIKYESPDSSYIGNPQQLSSAMTSPMLGGENMIGEHQNGLDVLDQMPISKNPDNSVFLPQKRFDDIDKYTPRHRSPLTLLQQTQFFSPPEPTPNLPVPPKGLSETLQETLSQSLGGANAGKTVTDTFNSSQHGLLPSNFSTIALSATSDIVEDWSLPTPSILSTGVNEPGNHQELIPTGWSGEEIGAVSIIALMVPFIICSNLLVILSIVRFRRLQIPTNYFITSLASVDVLVALATPFMIMVEVFKFGAPGGPGSDGGSGGALLCLLPNRILMMACSVSLLTLATIAYDRHTALVSPLDYVVIMTSRRVLFLVSLTWIYSVLVVWFPLVVGWHDSPTKLVQCSADLLHGKAHALFLGAIFLPSCGVILVCYARIFSLARHHAQAIAAVEFAVNRQAKFIMKDAKYAKTLALVIGVFLTLWLPYLITVFVKVVAGVTLSIWVQTYLVLVAVLNSGINPWIYAFKNKEFRHAFRRFYHEVFLERVCLRRLTRRRRKMSSAQTSVYSNSTPRLSRTECGAFTAGTVDFTTLDNVCEKLQRSLDSIDRFDKYQDRRLSGQCRAWRSGPLPGSFRALPTVANKMKRYRQAVSCTDLKDVEETQAILPRSLSVELVSSSNEDKIGDVSIQSKHIDIHSDKQIAQPNLTLSCARQRDIDTSLDNNSPRLSIPSLKHQYAWSPKCNNITGPANNLTLVSTPVTAVSSSLLIKSQQSKVVSYQNCSGTLPVSDLHRDTQSRLGLDRSSRLDVKSANSLIFPSHNFHAKNNETLEALRRDDMVFFTNEINLSSSQKSMSPRRTDFSTQLFESQPQRSTSTICTTDVPSLSHFARMDLCRGFIPEPSSRSCSVKLRVP